MGPSWGATDGHGVGPTGVWGALFRTIGWVILRACGALPVDMQYREQPGSCVAQWSEIKQESDVPYYFSEE